MERIMRLPEVCRVTGLSRSSIYAKVTDGTFPPPIKLGVRAAGWIEREVGSVIAARILGETEDSIRRLVMELVAGRKTAGHDVDKTAGENA